MRPSLRGGPSRLKEGAESELQEDESSSFPLLKTSVQQGSVGNPAEIETSLFQRHMRGFSLWTFVGFRVR